MRSRIIAVPQGGATPLTAWTEAGRSLSTKWEAGSRWDELSEKIVEFAQARDETHGTELFLCLLGDCQSAVADRDSLSRLLRQARDHAWGSPLFLALPRSLSPADMLRTGRELWRLWLEQAHADRALDCLQIEYTSAETVSLRDLRRAADRADLRRDILAKHASAQAPWRCVTQNRLLRSLLWPVAYWDDTGEPATHLMLVTDSSLPQRQAKEIESLYEKLWRPGRQLLVATLRSLKSAAGMEWSGTGEDRSPLDELCSTHQLPAAIELYGEVELWYFLLRLNAGFQTPAIHAVKEGWASVPTPWREYRTLPVTPKAPSVFLPRQTGAPTTIAITSAFDPGEPYHLRQAAADVGRIVEESLQGVRLLVEPAINLERLFRVMERMPDFDIWIHLGHGDGQHGLREAITGQYAPPERWLQAFRGRGVRLSLAMFLTCASAPIAQLFAEAGAGVAIGISGEVMSDKCRELAGDIVKAILLHGTGQEAILHGFYLGCNRIEAQAGALPSPSLPVAFYPRA